MITLGIETSCDETSVAIVKDGRKILSNVVASSLKEHKPYGGVVPEIASRAHLGALLPVMDASLRKAKIKLSKVDLVAVTRGPGLMGSLLVGISAAKALSFSLGKPLIGVDHVIAHIYAGLMDTKTKPPVRFPLIGLIVSGGHTLILRMDGPDQIRIVGRTLDDAAGEAFDKVAKILGLGYPGGPEIDKLARGASPRHLQFKKPILSKDSFDFSFSGIKTAVYYKVREIEKAGRLSPAIKKEICSHFQEAVCQALVEKTLAAAKKEHLKNIVVGGGVSANSRLRALLRKNAIFPSMALCQDNAAMIAGLGTALFRAGHRNSLDLTGYPNGHKA